MSEVRDKVRDILATSATLFLSTSSNDTPWVAGGFFVESDEFTLSMVLEGTGSTMRNIQANPNVAVVLSTGSPFDPFLQGSATVELLSGGEETDLVKKALIAKSPQTEQFLAAPIPLQAVRLTVTKWKATDVVNGWIPARELLADVDLREPAAAVAAL